VNHIYRAADAASFDLDLNQKVSTASAFGLLSLHTRTSSSPIDGTSISTTAKSSGFEYLHSVKW